MVLATCHLGGLTPELHDPGVTHRIIDKTIYVLLIADGRRDMQTLLQRRLLGA
jgi:hypothetical protein